jgi:hypothetical protein
MAFKTIRQRLNQLAGVIILAGVLWYVISLFLEVRGLRKMCLQIEVGSTLEVTKSRVREFGFYRNKESTATPGFLGTNGIYNWPIPSPMTLGDYVCVLSHDGFKVLSVQMSER